MHLGAAVVAAAAAAPAPGLVGLAECLLEEVEDAASESAHDQDDQGHDASADARADLRSLRIHIRLNLQAKKNQPFFLHFCARFQTPRMAQPTQPPIKIIKLKPISFI